MRNIWAFAWGAVVGVLGGLIGLGGAEFRLPVLVSIFNYQTLQAIAGIFIGIFSSMLGVAGGELIIPTIILLFAVDIKLAGSLSLAISMPTIMMGLFKYKNQQRLNQLKLERGFIAWMASGSILGAFIGSRLLGYVSSSLLYSILGTILLLSALKLARHKSATSD